MIARYDDEFEVRAFGDNLTKWGTSVVLIETGPYPGPDPDAALVRMNFVALLTSLDALASGRVDERRPGALRDAAVQQLEPAAHHRRPRHASRPARVWRRFSATSALPARVSCERWSGQRRVGFSAKIEELGDLRVFGALETIDATGLTAAPLWDKDVESGRRGRVAATGRGGEPVIAPGQPAAVVLLRPLADGRYRSSES